ncbi:MAG TPA: polysaccharide deacetylase family protein [Chthoniobacterales bacterium]
MTSVAATQFLPVPTTTTMAGRSLVVSLHDVAPPTWEVSRKIVAELKRDGIRACSLLVVPDYHHTGPSLQNAPFVSWLRELQTEGHEIVIHGYYHERPRPAGESLVSRFLTRIYTQDEGEFFDLPYDEAKRRIGRAREEFVDAGLNPHGFVAPAWLLGEQSERAARDAGMEYTIRLGSVRDLRSGDTFLAQSLVYSVRNAWRRQASLCWNALLAQLAGRRGSLMRLSVHPVDYTHPPIWNQIRRFITEMQSERSPTTYHDWMGEWRIRRNLDL